MAYFDNGTYEQLRRRRARTRSSTASHNPTNLELIFTELEKKWANKRISLCDHDIPTAKTHGDVARGDSDAFWNTADGGTTTGLWVVVEGKRRVLQQYLATGGCARISERFIIYGVIGSGTFGVVFAAREKTTGRHFAIKVMEAVNNEFHRVPQWKARSHWMTQYPELIDQAFDRWTADEVHVGLLVLDEPELSQVNSVYLHPPLLSVVMEQFAVINRPEMNSLPDLTQADYTHGTNTWNPDIKFHSVSGSDVMGGDDKSTMLNEMKVCKVSFDLLMALMKLLDRNMTHRDWSARNYLVDENCNAMTIDLDQIGLAASVFKDFQQSTTPAITSWEVFSLPEIAEHLTYYPNIGFFKATDEPTLRNDVKVKLDTRQNQLEHFGCSIFEMIHGFAPWEHPEQLVDDPATQDIGRGTKVAGWWGMSNSGVEFNEEKKRRRERIINDDLQIMDIQQLDQEFNPKREYNQVSQDCVDILRSMLSKEAEDRPTMLELCSFPWFQGWWAEKNAEECLRGTPPGFAPTVNSPDSQAGQPSVVQRTPATAGKPAAPGGSVTPGPAASGPPGGPPAPAAGLAAGLAVQGRPAQGLPTQRQPAQRGPTVQVRPVKATEKGKEKIQRKAPSQKTILEGPELTEALYILKLPPFPVSVSDATGQAQLKSWRDYVVQLALLLFDSKSLPAADLKRLLTLENGNNIPPPQNLRKARQLALGVDNEVDKDLSNAYRSFALLALSFYATRKVHLNKMPGRFHNPFTEKTSEEQSMGRGALLQFLNGPNFLPTPVLELHRYKLRNDKEFRESQKRRPNRKVRSPETEGPARPPPPHPGIMKPYEKVLKRKGRDADPIEQARKRQERRKGRWTTYAEYKVEETKYKAGERATFRGRRD